MMKNGKPRIAANCGVCGGNISTFGAGFFGDLWEGVKTPFRWINDAAKPLRGIAANVIGGITGVPSEVIEPYMGFASDKILGDGMKKKKLRRGKGLFTQEV